MSRIEPPVDYMLRTRRYYEALGYPAYRWASHDAVPFTPLGRPLAESRLVLITTAAPVRDGIGAQGPGAPYNAAAKFFEVYTAPVDPAPDLRISHLNYDRAHARADDPATWLPLDRLKARVASGRIAALGTSLVGVPTDRSQRATRERDAPRAYQACRSVGADVALLVPT